MQSMVAVQEIDLSINLLEGTIPQYFSQLSQLQTLLLQENALSGSLNGVFNASFQKNLIAVQLSSNQLTGTLPDEIFRLPQLGSLQTVSNCFTGSLSSIICNATKLAALALDGLQSASSCRQKLLPGLSNSYIAFHPLTGGVPTCMFEMPILNTLHLSGNGLTGSLPSDVVFGESLIDLSLSHNMLTGTIPSIFQSREWENLDLSYNRLTGTLQSNFSVAFPFNAAEHYPGTTVNLSYNSSTITLSLENNRLSGFLPHTIFALNSISVLGSNLFACKLDGSDLPQHDSGRGKYDCGSDSFNTPFYLWLSLAAIGVAAVILLRSSCVIFKPQARAIVDRTNAWLNIGDHCADITTVSTCQQDSQQSKSQQLSQALRFSNYRQVTRTFDAISSVSAICAAAVLLTLLPLYAATSHYYGTLTHQYAWTVSAAYKSGAVPMALEFLFHMLLMVLLLSGFSTAISWLRRTHIVNGVLLDGTKDDATFAIGASAAVRSSVRSARFAVYTAFFALNVMTVVGVNIAYVYVALYRSNSLLVVAQILLSAFKLIWNKFCCAYLVFWIAALTQVELTTYEAEYFAVQLFASLFNNIAIPCLTVAVISPACFYNLFDAAPPVVSGYTSLQCTVLDAQKDTCVSYTPFHGTTTYNPPFAYSYQCSSSFITYYAPAFVILAIMSAFVAPGLTLLLKWLHTKTGDRLSTNNNLFQALDAILPLILKPIGAVVADNAAAPHSKLALYFDANSQLVTILTFLGILLTFGAVFPPVAAALALTIVIAVRFMKLKVGRFLQLALEVNSLLHMDCIEAECNNVGSSAQLQTAVWMLISFSCCFYTLFLFDTLGDSAGFSAAYWVLVVMPLMPLVLYAFNLSVVPCIWRFPRAASVREDNSATESRREVTLSSEMMRHGEVKCIEMQESIDRSSAAKLSGDTTVNILHD